MQIDAVRTDTELNLSEFGAYTDVPRRQASRKSYPTIDHRTVLALNYPQYAVQVFEIKRPGATARRQVGHFHLRLAKTHR
jgi:hypothetical protein